MSHKAFLTKKLEFLDKINFIKTDFDPRVWGPKTWFYLETFVRSLPDDIDEDLEKEVKTFILYIAVFLPCTFCTKHMKTHIKDSNMFSLDFSKKEYVISWLNTLHNVRLTKEKERTIEEVNNYYKREYNANTTDYTDLLVIFISIAIVTFILKYTLTK